uniref:ABC transporter ATP-binding protein n=1 Tax=candidate division WOR-3 bacterium TaxID=2052148 RepID=A0A7C3J5P4_UNCW3
MLIKFILSYYKKTPLRIIFGFLMLILVDIVQLIIPRVAQKSIDYIVLGKDYFDKIVFLTIIIGLLALSIGILRFSWRMIILGMSHFIEYDFKNKLYDHLLKLDVSFFNRVKTGDLMAHMTNDMQAIRMSTAFGIISAFDSVFLFLATLIFMLRMNVKLTLLALLPLPFVSIITLISMKLNFKYFKKVQESFSNMTDKVQELISGIKIVQSFNQQEKEIQRFNIISKDYVDKNIILIKIWGIMFPLIFFFSDLGAAIVLFFGGQQTILGEISTGQFIAFFVYLGIITWPMMAVGFASNIFQRGNASFKRVYEFLKEEPKIKNKKDAKYILPEGDIEFKDVSFYYDKGNYILDKVSLKINKGEYVGIIGRIGTGKTTLIKLILRILIEREGKILFDGIDANDIMIEGIRDTIGYVPQDSFLFSMTIRDNIRFANKDADDKFIDEVIRISSFDKDLKDFKDGLNTLVGERGVTLSGGQKQRLCIARALVRKPKILILDDALSAVDTNTEKEILKNLYNYSKNITTIVISHRISSFINADNIYVLKDGKIESSGKHEELILKSPVYREFYRIQKLEE